jgi:hypothetical protein
LILFLSGFSSGCMAGRSDIAWFTSVHCMMMTLIIERVFVALVRNHVDKRSSTCCSLSACWEIYVTSLRLEITEVARRSWSEHVHTKLIWLIPGRRSLVIKSSKDLIIWGLSLTKI